MAPQFRDYRYMYHRDGDHDVVYEASDQNVSADPQYYGFLNEDGGWIIMEINQALGTFRYKAGTADYTTNWTNRAVLAYVYYNALFS